MSGHVFVSILLLSMIVIFDFGIVPTVWYFLFFILFQDVIHDFAVLD